MLEWRVPKQMGCLFLLSLMSTYCNKKNNNDSQDNVSQSGLQPSNAAGNQPGRLALNVALNLQDAFGAMVVDKSSSAGLALVKRHNDTVDKLKLPAKKFDLVPPMALTQEPESAFILEGESFYFPIGKNVSLLDSTASSSDTTSTFLKIKTDGTTGEAVAAESETDYQARVKVLQKKGLQYDNSTPQALPKILTVVESPTGEVYVHFENSFQYRDSVPGINPWEQSAGYQCQLFRLTGGTIDDLTKNAPSASNLECIDNKRFAQQWQQGKSTIFKFDSTGNVFYAGSLPSTNKMVVERIGRTDTWQQDPTEIINANICLQDFLVTPSSGVFYTGSTCNATAGSNNSGYFRYISPGNTNILEIARGWWNYTYNARVKATSDTSTSDSAVFFGPDPTDSTSASWNTACLFNFDPTGTTPQARISKVITCGNNIWDWMELRRTEDVAAVADGGLGFGYGFNNYTGTDQNFTPSAAWRTEYQRRCETADEVFAGGGSQISQIQQSSTGDIYVIGNIRKKVGGSLSCDLEIRGPHCKLNGVPILSGVSTSDNSTVSVTSATTCTTVGGTWVDNGMCDWGNVDNINACLGTHNSWIGSACTDDSTTPATPLPQFTSSNDCLNDSNSRRWNWGNDSYRNVTNEFCLAAETGSKLSFRKWDDASNHFTKTTSSGNTVYDASTYANKFIINNFSCTADATAGSTSGGDPWTQEFQALAKVDATKKTLSLLSKKTEQAINLWVIQDVPYYSSYDNSLGQYLLNKVVTAPALCVDTSIDASSDCTGAGKSWDTSYRGCLVAAYTAQSTCETAGFSWAVNAPKIGLSGFETYALSQSTKDGNLLVNGLDFSSNAYKFGNVDLDTGTIALDTGVTGIVQTVVIFNKK